MASLLLFFMLISAPFFLPLALLCLPVLVLAAPLICCVLAPLLFIFKRALLPSKLRAPSWFGSSSSPPPLPHDDDRKHRMHMRRRRKQAHPPPAAFMLEDGGGGLLEDDRCGRRPTEQDEGVFDDRGARGVDDDEAEAGYAVLELREQQEQQHDEHGDDDVPLKELAAAGGGEEGGVGRDEQQQRLVVGKGMSTDEMDDGEDNNYMRSSSSSSGSGRRREQEESMHHREHLRHERRSRSREEMINSYNYDEVEVQGKTREDERSKILVEIRAIKKIVGYGSTSTSGGGGDALLLRNRRPWTSTNSSGNDNYNITEQIRALYVFLGMEPLSPPTGRLLVDELERARAELDVLKVVVGVK